MSKIKNIIIFASGTGSNAENLILNYRLIIKKLIGMFLQTIQKQG